MKKKILMIIILIILMILIIPITLKYIQYLKSQSYIKIIINGQEINLTEEKNERPIDLEMLNSKADTKLMVQLKNATVKINNKKIRKSQEISLGQLNINEQNTITVETKKIGDLKYLKYQINTLPSRFPKYSVEGESQEEGEYYLSTYIINGKKGRHYVYKLNNKGELIFYKQTKSTPFNFKKNIVDGKIRYTYLEKTELYDGITTSVPARLVVLDENYNEINRIGYKTQNEEIDTENHDYIYLGDNHYIISAYTKQDVNNVPNYEGENIKVWNNRIQEIKDGNIIWEFESTKYPKLYEYYNEDGVQIDPSNPYTNYMHFNSMKIDPIDGNLICSFRNIDSIIKISRTTGEIIWILGGKGDEFGLTEEQKFSKQHSISFLKNHEILIYDNAYEKENTRVLIIKLDEENKKIEKYESYEIDAYIPRMGAVSAVNEEKNIYLLTYGIGKSDCAFKEVNLKTLEVNFKFMLENSNVLYCVNKF